MKLLKKNLMNSEKYHAANIHIIVEQLTLLRKIFLSFKKKHSAK